MPCSSQRLPPPWGKNRYRPFRSGRETRMAMLSEFTCKWSFALRPRRNVRLWAGQRGPSRGDNIAALGDNRFDLGQ